jgi:hypothetical protein
MRACFIFGTRTSISPSPSARRWHASAKIIPHFHGLVTFVMWEFRSCTSAPARSRPRPSEVPQLQGHLGPIGGQIIGWLSAAAGRRSPHIRHAPGESSAPQGAFQAPIRRVPPRLERPGIVVGIPLVGIPLVQALNPFDRSRRDDGHAERPAERASKTARRPNHVRLGDDRLPAPAPTPASAPTASAANEPENEEQQQRANRGVDDRRDNTDTKVDAELGQQPLADEGADDSNDEVTNDPKPGASHIWPASHPATIPTSTMTRRLSLDMCIFANSRFNLKKVNLSWVEG